MTVSAAVSVASFSVVLAETFAAVGLSTIVPTSVVTLARLAKQLAAGAAPVQADADKIQSAISSVGSLTAKDSNNQPKPVNPGDAIATLGSALGKALPSLDMLLPKDAKIHAEFTYEGRDSMSLNASAGGMINVVSVSAGFSELYESKSTNKITLDINFVSVNIPL